MKTERFSYFLLPIVCILVKSPHVRSTTEPVPVLMWESAGNSNSVDNSPSVFTKMSVNGFYHHVANQLSVGDSRNKHIVVFVEEMLSVEDFSRTDAHGFSSYPFLTNLTSTASTVSFLPSVQKPLKALERLNYEWHVLDVRDATNITLPAEGGAIFVVYFGEGKDVEPKRSSALKQHDQIIFESYNKILSHSHVIGIYTSNRLSRDELDSFTTRKLFAVEDYEEEEKKNGTMWYDSLKNATVFLYFHTDPFFSTNVTGTNDTLDIDSIISVIEEMDGTDLQRQYQLNLTVDFTGNTTGKSGVLNFIFYLSAFNYWKLEEIQYSDEDFSNETLRSFTEIYAPKGFSYHCSNNITFTSESTNLYFPNVQIEAFIEDRDTLRFGDAYDCVPFYTPAILSGLFVTVMITLITMWGLSMIMSIHTNDQYDDPKGKTITVSSTD
ncbi:V-type proton ATPase subunit S1 [Anabrus simplex]|uniref:V-type proton ATPase subunit S1 n=1 Tax=Anabrus simplex TaxID=316456 RepID=UPI0035A2769C